MNSKKASSYFLSLTTLVIVLSMLLTSCGSATTVAVAAITATTAPTDTPQPTSTSTPVPTDTPTITPSPTVTRTATPDRKATLAARQTATQAAAEKMVGDELTKLGIDPSLGHVAWVMKEPAELDGSGWAMGWFQPIKDLGVVKDFVMQSKITWKTSGALAGCSYMFRAPEDWDVKIGDFYDLSIIRNKYDPVWLIDYFKDGRWEYTLPRSSGVSSANLLDDNDTQNVLTLDARGDKFTIYINGVKERTVENNKITEGRIAFEVIQNSGTSYCKFEDAWVWEYDK